MTKLATICLALAAALAAGTGPSPAETSQALHYGHYGDVRALCRVGDSLWVGTGGGLLIYDLAKGGQPARILIGGGLPSSSVRVITNRGDSVFVGTDGGLSIFSGGSVEILTGEHPGPYRNVPFASIRKIDFGLGGVIYLSTYGDGVGVLDGETSWVITREDSLLDDKVYGVLQQDDSTYYFATSMGLCAYRDSAWVGFQAGAGIPRAEIKKILPAPDLEYYLLVGGRGIYRFNGRYARRISYPGLVSEDMYSDMVLDNRANLWVCGALGGVAVYQNGNWTRINEGDQTLSALHWRCAFADDEGRVFFGSGDGMIISIDDNVLSRIKLPEELETGSVTAIESDSTGAVYLLDGSYLFRVPRGSDELEPDYRLPEVVAVTVSPRGGLWLVTRWGIYYRRGGDYVEFEPQVPEPEPFLSAVAFDAEGNLWVGLHNGNVFRYDGEIWMRMGDGDQFAFGSVRLLDFDGDDRLWVIGSDGGVWMFDGRRWTDFAIENFGGGPAVGLAVSPTGVPVIVTEKDAWQFIVGEGWKRVDLGPEQKESGVVSQAGEAAVWEAGKAAIRSVAFDRDGRLFFGTENGLVIADGTGSRWITSEAGLGGKTVLSLFADASQNLWIGFRKDGLTRVNLKSLW